jgi:hypothetical protein
MALLEKVKLDRGRVNQHTKGLGQNQPVRASEFNDVVTYLNDRSSDNTTNTVTLSSNAGTLSKVYGTITTESQTTAAGDFTEFVITNSLVTANSIVLAVISEYNGSGSPVINIVNPAAGSFTITVANLAPADALDDALTIKYIVY